MIQETLEKPRSIIPLASRIIPMEKRDKYGDLANFINEVDKLAVNNVCRGLYESGLDIYIRSEQHPNEHIDLIAHAQNNLLKQRLIERLQRSNDESGSDAWVHFGFTAYKNAGFHINEIPKGSRFYSEEVSISPDLAIFTLTPAIYIQKETDPSQINLFFPSSLEEYNIIF